jgi:hypothetical protein
MWCSKINSHQVMGNLQRPLISPPYIVHERVDLVLPHQIDREMLRGGALDDGIRRIDVTDVRCNDLLDATPRG